MRTARIIAITLAFAIGAQRKRGATNPHRAELQQTTVEAMNPMQGQGCTMELERAKGIEPSYAAWETDLAP